MTIPAKKPWRETLPRVRVVSPPETVFTQVFVNDQEWAASVKSIRVRPDEGATLIEMVFYGHFETIGRANVITSLPEGWTADDFGTLQGPTSTGEET